MSWMRHTLSYAGWKVHTKPLAEICAATKTQVDELVKNRSPAFNCLPIELLLWMATYRVSRLQALVNHKTNLPTESRLCFTMARCPCLYLRSLAVAFTNFRARTFHLSYVYLCQSLTVLSLPNYTTGWMLLPDSIHLPLLEVLKLAANNSQPFT
ncbi:hypothetical protein F5141DRAFT_496942 [Pisolithus sp. B1]|nr:hypothetical protein F5141DRAFT_496942 [Pisolithus sp. B1]